VTFQVALETIEVFAVLADSRRPLETFEPATEEIMLVTRLESEDIIRGRRHGFASDGDIKSASETSRK